MMSAAELPANDPRRTQQTLTARDLRLAVALQTLGMRRTESIVLVAMTRYGMGANVNSRWLKRVTDLRQPEVSIATKNLIEAGLVLSEEDRESPKAGRPTLRYSLARNPLDYVNDIVEQKKTAIHESAQAVYAAWQGVAA